MRKIPFFHLIFTVIAQVLLLQNGFLIQFASCQPGPGTMTPSQEIQVNTYVTSNQYWAVSAGLSGGRSVIVWSSDGQDSSIYGIYAQMFNANGSPSGGEFRVNTETQYEQQNPAIAVLMNGGFVIVWQSKQQDGSTYGIYAQRYDSVGVKVGSEFLVNTNTVGEQSTPAIAPLSLGGFLIVWQDSNKDGDGFGICSQRYTAAGDKNLGEVQVNTYTAGDQLYPTVATLTDGKYVIAWQSYEQTAGEGYDIYYRMYNPDGSTYGVVNKANNYMANDQTDPAVAALPNGNFVLTWTSYGQDAAGGRAVVARLFDSSANSIAGFQVNTYQQYDQMSASVAPLKDGAFMVVWASNNQDGDGFGIYGQAFDSTGTPSGSEFRVNDIGTGNQNSPYVTSLTNGFVVITWSDNGRDGNLWGVFAKRICPNTSPNFYSTGNACYTTCPAEAPNLYNKACYTECPIGARYSYNNLCYASCPAVAENAFNLACYATCPAIAPYLYDYGCYVNCPDDIPYSYDDDCYEDCSETPFSYTYNRECILACPPEAPNFHNTQCYTDCPNDVPYLLGQECVSTCSGTAPYVENGVCVALCSMQFPIEYNQVCYSSCPPEAPYLYNFQCYTSCPDVTAPYAYDHQCSSSCPGMAPLIYNYECFATCPTTAPYLYGQECKISCPVDKPLIENSVCVTACSAQAQYKYNQVCYSSCPAEAPYSYNQICYATCPNTVQYIYNNECRANCPATAPNVYNQKCYTNCPSIAPKIYNQQCYANCPITAPYSYEKECYAICPTPAPYLYSGNCYVTCPRIAPNAKEYVCLADDIKAETALVGGQQQVTSAAMKFTSALSSNNPSIIMLASLNSMILYLRYLKIDYPNKVRILFSDQQLISVSFDFDIPESLENSLSQRPLPDVFEEYEVHSSFLYNIWDPLLSFIIILASTVLIMLIESRTRKFAKVHAFFQKLTSIAKWNLPLLVLSGNYSDIVFYMSLEFRTVQFDSASSVMSFLICLLLVFLSLLLLVKSAMIVRSIRRSKQQNIETDKSLEDYSVLYEEFEENSYLTLGYIPIFSARITIFNLLITTAFDEPLLQAIFINLLSVLMIVYLAWIRPFKSRIQLIQLTLNETLLLIFNFCILILAILDARGRDAQQDRTAVGDVMLILMMVFSSMNLGFTVVELVRMIFGIWKKVKAARAKGLASFRQIAKFIVESEFNEAADNKQETSLRKSSALMIDNSINSVAQTNNVDLSIVELTSSFAEQNSAFFEPAARKVMVSFGDSKSLQKLILKKSNLRTKEKYYQNQDNQSMKIKENSKQEDSITANPIENDQSLNLDELITKQPEKLEVSESKYLSVKESPHKRRFPERNPKAEEQLEKVNDQKPEVRTLSVTA